MKWLPKMNVISTVDFRTPRRSPEKCRVLACIEARLGRGDQDFEDLLLVLGIRRAEVGL